MLWYNTSANVLQRNNPAGDFASDEYMAEFYPAWVKVDDDFQLPVDVPEPTKADKLAEVEEKYVAALEKAKDALLSAELMGRDTTKIKENYQALFKEYIAARKAVA